MSNFNFLWILCSSFMVVVINNPIYSILYLIIVFISSSVLFITFFGMQFLGFIILIVYLGAVIVLFLFIVMLLNIKILELRRNINFYPFLFMCFSCAFFFFFSDFVIFPFEFNVLFLEKNFQQAKWNLLFIYTDSFFIIGKYMYTYIFIYFIIASVVLLIAMLGAIILTNNQLKKVKKKIAYKQLIRNRTSLSLFKIE